MRTSKRQRDEQEGEHKRWVIEQLNLTRGMTFALQVSGDPPPSWEDIQRQKKNKPPQQGQVNKNRKSWEQQYEAHMESISSPYAWEAAMGLNHMFDPPPPETVKTSQEFRAQRRKEIAARERRLIGQLDRFIEKHGDTPIDQVVAGREDW